MHASEYKLKDFFKRKHNSLDHSQGIFPESIYFQKILILGYSAVNSLFLGALCFDGMIVNTGVTCGFSPCMAWFSSHETGQSCKKTGKRFTEQNPVLPVWPTPSLEKHLQFPCSRQCVFKSVWLEVAPWGDVSSHCWPHLPENSTNKIFGKQQVFSCAVSLHVAKDNWGT